MGLALGFGGLAGFRGGTQGKGAGWQGQRTKNAATKSTFGGHVINLYPRIHLLRSLEKLGVGTVLVVAGSHCAMNHFWI